MTRVLVDTGFIVASLDRSDRYHSPCVAVDDTFLESLITCEAVIAESCHLLRKQHGASEAILKNVQEGIIQIPFTLANRATHVAKLLKKYADLPIDLADACLVDLATQMGTGKILTLDSDFRIYRWGRNRPFELLMDIT